jgi:hypothetical protein
VRVGVYGRWGEGKTTVLTLVWQELEARGCIVAWFKPWGCSTSAGMWREFVRVVLEALKKANASASKPIRATVAKLIRTSAPYISVAAKAAARAKGYDVEMTVPDGALRKLEEWAEVSEPEILKLLHTARLKTRLVILIDDVDRLDPKLLPELLYALREILDIPGLSFILALDPELVGNALKTAQYAHFSARDGQDFLRKIVDFPMQLQSPEPDHVWSFFSRELNIHCAELVPGDLEELRDLIPTNPRALRAVVRELWVVGAELARHTQNELDVGLSFLIAVIRVQFPAVAANLLVPGPLLEAVHDFGMDSLGSDDVRTAASKALVESMLDEESKREGLPERERALLRASVMAFAERGLWTPQKVAYQAGLQRESLAVTLREAEAFAATVKATPEHVDAWVQSHGRRVGRGAASIRRGLFAKLRELHNQRLSDAADATGDVAVKQWVARAESVLNLIEILAVGSGGFGGESPTFGPPEFQELIYLVRSWSHFGTDAYVHLRRSEARVALAVCGVVRSGALSLLEVLMKSRDLELAEKDARLDRDMFKALLPAAARELVGVFEKPNAVRRVIFANGMRAARAVLFARSSPFWEDLELRPDFSRLRQDGEAGIENARCFMSALLGREPHRVSIPSEEAAAFFEDRQLIDDFWTLICSQPPNFRMFGTVVALKKGLEEKGFSNLIRPAWWDRIEKEHAERDRQNRLGLGRRPLGTS